jgi:hypothetical protein
MLKARKILYAVCLMGAMTVFGGAVTAHAKEDVSIKVSADKTIATLGDRIHYRVEVSYDDPVIVLTDIPNDHVEQFTIKDIKDSAQHPENTGRHTITREYVLVPYNVGEMLINPFTIEYKTGAEDATVRSISSDSIIITVESVFDKPEVEDIRGIKDIIDMKKTLMRYAVTAGSAAGGLVLLALLIALVRFILQRLKKDQDHLLTPFELSIKRLFELRSSKLIAEGRIAEFTDKISDIVRSFLGKAFRFETMDLTTTELNSRCAEVGVDIEVHNRLNVYLQDCDLVKFARHVPTSQELDQLFNEAQGLVEKINAVTEKRLAEEASELKAKPADVNLPPQEKGP